MTSRRPVQLDLFEVPSPRSSCLADIRIFPSVGEMYEGRLMTVARHRSLLISQLIANEEASGDPELLRVAAMRRRWNGMAPRVEERRA